MTVQTFTRPFTGTLIALFVATLLIFLAVKAAHVLVLTFLAVLIGLYLSAITDELEHRFLFRRWVGLSIAVAGTLAVLAGFVALILPPVWEQTRAFLESLPATLTEIQIVLANWSSRHTWLQRTQLSDPESGLVAEVITSTTEFMRGSVLPYAREGGELFVELAGMVVMGIYLARNPTQYRDGIVSLVPPARRDLAREVLSDIGTTLRSWIVGQLLAMAVLAALTAIGLWLLGVEYWLAFGIFTGLVAVVPFIGTLVSTLLPALFVIATGSWWTVGAVLLLGIGVHLFEANVVVPRIMERKVALPPMLTIASVFLMGTLLGPVGLVVAVPILAVVMVLVRQVLLGAIYGEPPHVTEPPLEEV